MVKPTKTVNFREFMKGNAEPRTSMSEGRLVQNLNNLNAYSLVITPGMFIDPLFVSLGGAVLLLALVEKTFGTSGHTEIAELIGKIIKFAFPIVLAIAGYVFFVSNPLLHWL